jgi:hypothetical protein
MALARRRPALPWSNKTIEGVEVDTNIEEDSRGERSGTIRRR